MIAARMGVVRRDGLDACVYAGARRGRRPTDPSRRRHRGHGRSEAGHAAVSQPLPGEEFEKPAETPAPVPETAAAGREACLSPGGRRTARCRETAP